jgi:hypothetical protein
MEFVEVPEFNLEELRRFGNLSLHAKILLIGCGGGGDIAGCLPLYYRLLNKSFDVILGSIVWERTDDYREIGPIRFDNISDLVSIPDVNPDVVVFCTPESKRISDGLVFQAAKVSKALNTKIMIININYGPKQIAESLDAFCKHESMDLIICLDVGGDVIARGDEPGLESPLADAISLASCYCTRTRSLLAIYGPNADGEISLPILSNYYSEFLKNGILMGRVSHSKSELASVKRIIESNNIITEASMQPILVSEGRFGINLIRNGSRKVLLHLAMCATYIFKLDYVFPHCPIANVILDSVSIEDANNRILKKMNIITEYEFEKRKHAMLFSND